MTEPAIPTAPETPAQAQTRETYLLHQIEQAPDRRISPGDANRRIPAAIARQHDLSAKSATALRGELTTRGLIRVEKKGRSVTLSLTDAGRAFLEQHRSALPAIPQRKIGAIHPPSNENVRAYRVSYLLLQLLKAPAYRLRPHAG